MNDKRDKQVDKKEADIMPTTFYHPPKWRDLEEQEMFKKRIEDRLKARGIKLDD